MTTVAVLSLVATGISVVALVLQAVDKMAFVQKDKVLKTWIDDANDIAGELKLIIPMSANLADVEVAAEIKAAALVKKYAGSVTQEEAVTQIIGELARIVQSGHILPPSVEPAVSEVAELTAAVKALLAQKPPSTGPSPVWTPVVTGGSGGGASTSQIVSNTASAPTTAPSAVPLAPA
jgi:hypothetical protein